MTDKIAKGNFLWYKPGEKVKEEEYEANPHWKKHFEEVGGSPESKPNIKPKEEKYGIREKIIDILDDGKLNKSYKPKGKKNKK